MSLLNQSHEGNIQKNRWATNLSRHYSIPLPSSLNLYEEMNNDQNQKSKKKLFVSNSKYMMLLSMLIFISVITPCIYITYTNYTHSSLLSPSCMNRKLLSTEEEGETQCFPKAADPWWIAIFCFLGTLYMFIALSIVCDEFFVPALETIALKLSLSNDVAGATLMAAGGSAPELFTSLIGTFQKTDVGFAAIVGSAVFNVLFVIGVCAFAAPSPLQLTWYPLARDCTFYSFGLIVLSIFFTVTTKREIHWYEALILFVCYIGYVIFMKYNEKFHKFLTNFIESRKAASRLERSKTTVVLDCINDGLDRTRLHSIRANNPEAATFRAGMMNILLKDDWDWTDVASISVVNSIVGDVTETFNKLDKDQNGYLDDKEMICLLQGLDLDEHANQDFVENLMKELDVDKDGKLSFREFSIWYLKSEERILNEMKSIFNFIDQDNNGALSASELHAFLLTLGVEDMSHEEITKVIREYQQGDNNSNDLGMTFDEFKSWFVSTKYYKDKLNAWTKQAECVESIDNIFEFPQSCMARFWFILSMPLILLFVFSIPDTRKPDKAKYCYLSFAISILWIGVFSYFLVEWTSTVGDTLSIPLVVMGLTFLAAGTSIPDLLSSVIVAKQGHGDMAVSSSIGSNIFDILVGLPIPWLLFSIYYDGDAVVVNADALEISILILLGMLIAIIIIIKLSQWRMTKRLGIAMMILYVMFVAQDLARADWSC